MNVLELYARTEDASRLELRIDEGFEVSISLSSFNTAPDIRVSVIRDGSPVTGPDAVHVSSGDVLQSTMRDLKVLRGLHRVLVSRFKTEGAEFETRTVLTYVRSAASSMGFTAVSLRTG